MTVRRKFALNSEGATFGVGADPSIAVTVVDIATALLVAVVAVIGAR